MDMTQQDTHILILGGGTAGWLTAGLIASEYGENAGVSVTLVESPDVKTIGVGEGTWPTMRTTLRRIGLSESEFIRHCSASFKQGTRFNGWVSGEPGDTYYHPFSAPAGYHDGSVLAHWLRASERSSFTDAVCTQGALCDRDLAPKQVSTPEYAGVVNYGYHLDASKFAGMLQEHCVDRLGVKHITDHVDVVNGEPAGDIVSLTTREHGDLSADLYVDCTGFAALLIGQHYGVPFINKQDILLNDAALAAQVPYTDAQSAIASQTNSTAQSAGWIWDIGLSSRRGVGYVYSSRHTSEDEARRVLAKYTTETGGEPVEARRINFEAGHRDVFWKQNCVAVGLSAGFLEPLEASALVLVELSARMIAEELPANRELMTVAAGRFNDKFRYRWDRIIDFLKLHYLLSHRDEPYWRDSRDPSTVPESLRDYLSLWAHQAPRHSDFAQYEEVFSAASYQYVLYGMGYETALRHGRRVQEAASAAIRQLDENHAKTQQFVDNLPGNRELLNAINQQGLPKGESASA